jgi:hypothetical protein
MQTEAITRSAKRQSRAAGSDKTGAGAMSARRVSLGGCSVAPRAKALVMPDPFF